MMGTLAYFPSCKGDEEMLQNPQFILKIAPNCDNPSNVEQLGVKFEPFIPISVSSLGCGVAHRTQAGSFRPP
jgi:hypothetical protein